MSRLIASVAIAMALITVVPLSIALGIWLRNIFKEIERQRELGAKEHEEFMARFNEKQKQMDAWRLKHFGEDDDL